MAAISIPGRQDRGRVLSLSPDHPLRSRPPRRRASDPTRLRTLRETQAQSRHHANSPTACDLETVAARRRPPAREAPLPQTVGLSAESALDTRWPNPSAAFTAGRFPAQRSLLDPSVRIDARVAGRRPL